MDEKNVNSFDDLLAAADAKLNAPIEPITKPATSVTGRQAAPEDNPADDERHDEGDPGDEDNGGGQDPEPEASFDVDGEKLTTAEIRQLKRDAQRVKEADEAQRAAQYLLRHPEEYERVRRENGLAPRTPAPAPEVKPQSTGPDPVEDVNGWKYARFNQYIEYLQQRGQTATVEAIQAQVEIDHDKARTNRLMETIAEERAERKKDAERREQEQAAWRLDQEAAQIARTLNPLFQKYPKAAGPEGQEEVEARIIRAVHLGQPVDYEKIVKAVHERNGGVIRKYVEDKRAMAGGAGPAVARGGSARGARPKLQDTLPADFSSISRYAEMKERGET